MSFPYAICNETFEGWDHARVCGFVREVGYAGLEIAPFTLAARAGDVTADRRRQLRAQAETEGLTVVGLHWLLARTEGLHLTSPDLTTRRRTSDYLADLARLCRDLGGSIMVLGSPQQRRLLPGVTPTDADACAHDVIVNALPALEETGVRLCLEPLAPAETDFWNTCAEVAAFADRLAHPNVTLQLDVKAMASESVPVPDLVRRHGTRAGHFHANDPNRRGPGFGNTDFRPIFHALADAGYGGCVSVEVFDYSPDPETIARRSLEYMRRCETA
jgi:sugar phosphate isomerase/epimerase